MSVLTQKLAQLYLPDSTGDFAENLRMLERYQPAGLLLFARDLAGLSEETVKEQLAAYRQARPGLIIAIDQEGGLVSRLSALYPDRSYPSQADLLEKGLDFFLEQSKKTALELKNLGINLNFAPVADLAMDPASFIYSRTFKTSPEKSGQAVSAFVKLYRQLGLACCAKHFPGYGDAGDTHHAPASDHRTPAQGKLDLQPFQAAISSGVPAVMVSHLHVPLYSDRPASLAPEVYRLLKQELHYSGVALTDDLAMAAPLDYAAEKQTCPEVLALAAGA
ncbi:glycoside hydrolase family 3 N-terminal domain-containing protein, partial [Lactobacillus nasalidis]